MSAEALTPALLVFNLPDLGEGLTEAELVSWLVKEGDEVMVDQAIAEVETAKSVVEVPSRFAGTVAVLHGAPGETLDVGAPLISVRATGTAGTATPDVPGSAAEAASATEAYRTEERAGISPTAALDKAPVPEAESGSGNVLIGYGTPGGLTGGRTRKRRTGTSASRQESGQIVRGPVAGNPAAGESADRGEDGISARRAVLCVSPLVRKAAREAGLTLGNIPGSGPDGLILRRDVEAVSAAQAGPPSSSPRAASVAAPETSPSSTEAGAAVPGTDPRSGLPVLDRTPLRGVRKTVADTMSRSRREIPEATVWVDADVTALVELRAQLKMRGAESAPGLLAFIARFVVAGLDRYPELNTRINILDDGSQEILRVAGVNLGLAAQTDRGLLVPSVRNADRMNTRELDVEIRRLAALARVGKATPADLTSGTFTLNNYGVFGVDGSAAIINFPESAILGVGRIIDRPWVVGGALAVRKVTELTLSFDHRVCDGGTAGGFLRYVADAMENPGSVLADL
ncbi:pyruvate dehydrogenase E2 component (dihydrolipoamide acetyltransferase) [Arthrobacter sp. CAN_A214]|uniref:dihydrolipoamide acetyltransferase family protein n=1 Tax=Arthrobacter sp. CAN_A214 TaxID=2787720 RepID=UPI0018CA8C86